jgi:hypothetical protein
MTKTLWSRNYRSAYRVATRGGVRISSETGRWSPWNASFSLQLSYVGLVWRDSIIHLKYSTRSLIRLATRAIPIGAHYRWAKSRKVNFQFPEKLKRILRCCVVSLCIMARVYISFNTHTHIVDPPLCCIDRLLLDHQKVCLAPSPHPSSCECVCVCNPVSQSILSFRFVHVQHIPTDFDLFLLLSISMLIIWEMF